MSENTCPNVAPFPKPEYVGGEGERGQNAWIPSRNRHYQRHRRCVRQSRNPNLRQQGKGEYAQ